MKRVKLEYRKFRTPKVKSSLSGKGAVALVDAEICMGCIHCFDNCPVDCIDMIDERLTVASHTYDTRKAFIVAERCIGCTKCAVVCPVDAIDMLPLPGWEVQEGKLVNVEAAQEV